MYAQGCHQGCSVTERQKDHQSIQCVPEESQVILVVIGMIIMHDLDSLSLAASAFVCS